MNSINIEDLIDLSDLKKKSEQMKRIAEECADKANQKHDEDEQPQSKDEPENEDTLEELTSSWKAATTLPNETRDNTPMRTMFKEKYPPFLKKEEVLDYWRDHTVTEPYINVIMENVFGVPHEIIYDYENEYTKMGKIPVRPTPLDKEYRRIELWGRVLSTLDFNKTETPSPTFREDVEKIRRNALSEVSMILQSKERRERKAAEDEMRNGLKRARR